MQVPRTPTEAVPQAQAAAQKALALDKTLSEAHFALGFVRFWYDWRWADAEAEFRRAIELGPDSAQPYLGLAHLLSNLGRQHEALAEIRRARALDPLSLITNTLEASFLSLARRDEEALARLQTTFDIEPDFWVAYLNLGRILFTMGRSAEAIDALRKARALSGDGPHAIAALGYVHARSGDAESAQACLRELHALSAKRYVPPSNYATIHCGLGETDQALERLEQAYAERDVWMTFLKIDRRCDALRDNPRFAALARRMELD
jgi:Flp pilus assembly protein TadD